LDAETNGIQLWSAANFIQLGEILEWYRTFKPRRPKPEDSYANINSELLNSLVRIAPDSPAPALLLQQAKTLQAVATLDRDSSRNAANGDARISDFFSQVI